MEQSNLIILYCIIIFKKCQIKTVSHIKLAELSELGLVLVGYICEKRWGRRPICDFPKK